MREIGFYVLVGTIALAFGFACNLADLLRWASLPRSLRLPR